MKNIYTFDYLFDADKLDSCREDWNLEEMEWRAKRQDDEIKTIGDAIMQSNGEKFMTEHQGDNQESSL